MTITSLQPSSAARGRQSFTSLDAPRQLPLLACCIDAATRSALPLGSRFVGLQTQSLFGQQFSEAVVVSGFPSVFRRGMKSAPSLLGELVRNRRHRRLRGGVTLGSAAKFQSSVCSIPLSAGPPTTLAGRARPSAKARSSPTQLGTGAGSGTPCSVSRLGTGSPRLPAISRRRPGWPWRSRDHPAGAPH